MGESCDKQNQNTLLSCKHSYSPAFDEHVLGGGQASSFHLCTRAMFVPGLVHLLDADQKDSGRRFSVLGPVGPVCRAQRKACLDEGFGHLRALRGLTESYGPPDFFFCLGGHGCAFMFLP